MLFVIYQGNSCLSGFFCYILFLTVTAGNAAAMEIAGISSSLVENRRNQVVAKSTGINFTVSSLDKLHIPSKGIVTYKDTKFPALSIYVTSTGVKTFFVRKREKGKDERLIIGRFPEIKLSKLEPKRLSFVGMVADKKIQKQKSEEKSLIVRHSVSILMSILNDTANRIKSHGNMIMMK
ncbi:MAG: DUF4102 domain-containing protein [Bacteroidetes bacterium]|nr:DUF4102 domain-containing protein [Bacteroidota bacterium]